ncbi:MAG: NADH-quinone oxidoreductase subunit NuoK [Candidatus Comchoanobacterales bacterium]
MIPIEHIMIFSSVLWLLGLLGVIINRQNVIMILMSLEVMFLAVNSGLIGIDQWMGQHSGQLMVIFTLTIAAAEAAIALAIFILIYRQYHRVDTEALETLKG